MSNQKITNLNYNTEQISLPLEIQEETCVPKKENYAPTFISYNNQQGISLLDIQDLIPKNHIANVINEMIESVESVFGHIKGNRSFNRFLLRGLE